jgi:pimeloyl-ACP methyl ester carboxylesterase
METIRFTASGVRLRKRKSRPGELNWLLVPGGPGIGSDSLEELAEAIDVAGAVWLVDLPQDGSNQNPPGLAREPFSDWPHVVVEAADAVPNPVMVGHSTGGMYLLATAALEARICGLALLDTAPDCSWVGHFEQMTKRHPLPAVDAAMARYVADKSNVNIAEFAVASAEWNFTPEGVERGRELLARMPYSSASVDWSEAHFDHVYRAAWWPKSLPTLILAGAQDKIVWQGGWDDEWFHEAHVIHRSAPNAGHFPWIENPKAVAAAFAELNERILARAAWSSQHAQLK